MTRHLQINVRIKSRKPADKRQAFHTGTQKGEQEKEILKKLFLEAVSYIEHKFTVLSMTAFLAGIA